MKIVKKILSDIKYHNIVNSVSGTELKNFIYNKRKWWAITSFNKENHKKIKEKSKGGISINENSYNENLRIGSAIHCKLLEPKKFKNMFNVFDGDYSDIDLTKKLPVKYTKQFEEQIENSLKSGKSYILPHEKDNVNNMYNAVKNHLLYNETIGDSLKNKLTEFQIILSDIEYHDIFEEKVIKYTLKGKLDIVNLFFNDKNEIIEIRIGDIKTTSKGVGEYTNNYSFDKTHNIHQCLYYEYLVTEYIKANNNEFSGYKVADKYTINSYYVVINKSDQDVLFINVDIENKDYNDIRKNIIEMVTFNKNMLKNYKFSHKEKFYNLKYKKVVNNDLEEVITEEDYF